MTLLDVIILGIVQGLTEFLPISSSGHLQLFQYFLGFQALDQLILFDLICHCGTLLAILWAFSTSIRETFKSDKEKLMQVLLATLPLFPLVLLLKPIKSAYAAPHFLGIFFILTAFILFLGSHYGKNFKKKNPLYTHQWRDAFLIGFWQALAILPGVSRSASTISGARLLGWSTQEALFFSFLLAIPAILGGTTLEILKLWQQPESAYTLPLSYYLIGFLTSFCVGLGALQWLVHLANKDKFYYFAWYCLILGIATTCYFHL